jgi:hypothetical protein
MLEYRSSFSPPERSIRGREASKLETGYSKLVEILVLFSRYFRITQFKKIADKECSDELN